MTAEANAPASTVHLAPLRDRITARLHDLSEVKLRYVVQELGLAADGEPSVTKYEDGKYKPSTDPVINVPSEEARNSRSLHQLRSHGNTCPPLSTTPSKIEHSIASLSTVRGTCPTKSPSSFKT